MSAAQTQTLKLERLFDCTLQEMWSAWSDPKQYARWFNPFPGKDAIIETWEFREGGSVSFYMVDPDGNRLPNSGNFLLIDPPHEIVTGEGDMRVRVRFEEVGDKTKLILEQTGLPQEIPLDDVRGGWGAILDKLETLFTRRRTQVHERSIVLTRILDAPRTLVYKAFTDPEQVASWWGPEGFGRNTVHEMDVRVGGKWRYTMHGPDGTDYENLITYTEVQEPELLAYDHGTPDEPQMFRGSATFEDLDGATRLVFEMVLPTKEALEVAMRDVGAVEGGNQTLDKLEAHLRALQV